MLTMEAYLDNSATTRCSEAAKNKMVEALTVDFGNPSSMHMKGVEAEKYVKEATTAIAKTLRCQEKEIVFTSGGTESNNLAIIGTALANQRAGKHIITTSVEHASVKNTRSNREDLAISQNATVHRKKQRKSLAGKQNTASKICVQILGDGRARIQTDTTTNHRLNAEKHSPRFKSAEH